MLQSNGQLSLENCGIIGDKLDGINNGPGQCGQGQLYGSRLVF